MRRTRLALFLNLVFVLLLLATTAAPSAAAGPTPYTAAFGMELTTQRTCPPGVPPPPSSFCYTGQDHSGTGTSSAPTPPAIAAATEDFAGFVDFTSPIANACPPD